MGRHVSRIYRGTRPVGLPPGRVLPAWTHLVRVVLDAGMMPLTGDDLAESPDLTVVRAWLEARLLTELVTLHMDAPENFANLAERAAAGLGSPQRPTTVAALLAQLVGSALQPDTAAATRPVPAPDITDTNDQALTEALDTAKRLAAERRRSRSLRGWSSGRAPA